MATLVSITALARAGAVERAWALLEQGGYLGTDADPAALAVKGRLLKDRARRAEAGEREALFRQAADAYGRAHTLTPAPYLAINAATARLLAGDAAGAAEGARATLALLDAPEPPADTAYYLAATRAEALLLLGDEAGAQAAMVEAARHDPDGWEDRAVTLTQLRTICGHNARDLAWLEAFAPPPSLHFVGHLGIAAGGTSEARLADQVDAFIAEHKPGFAWGAIAAGTDIVIAERLLAVGCAIHLVLPCPPDLFEAQSVAPAGATWAARYRALLDAAASLRVAGPGASSVHDPIATAHAGELAIGGALLNARRLGAAALQLVVADEAGGGTNTRRQADMWPSTGGKQFTLTAPRDSSVDASFPPEQLDPERALTVHVAIELDSLPAREVAPSAVIAAAADPLSALLATLDRGAVRAFPGGWELTLTDLPQALKTVAALLAATRGGEASPPAIGLALDMATLHADRASGALVPYGPGAALARRLQAMAPAGTALASDAAAVCLAVQSGCAMRSELYHAGEPELGGAVHTLLEV
jgi:hypothetical protein